jgi:acylphosphatase
VTQARAHAVIRGRVQGVLFRAETSSRARSLGLTGWVRNTHDGAVETVFEGPKERVDVILRWCERGPTGAHVTSVDVEWEEARGEPGFEVR